MLVVPNCKCTLQSINISTYNFQIFKKLATSRRLLVNLFMDDANHLSSAGEPPVPLPALLLKQIYIYINMCIVMYFYRLITVLEPTSK